MERRHEVTRLEGFSDAVFGFALTLLVVSLEMPRNTAELVENMRGFVPFALMFAMICWIWYEHQRFFRNYGLQDAWTVAVNCFLLFVVLFYVYPLKFLTVGLYGRFFHVNGAPSVEERGDVVMLLYSTGVVLMFGSFVMLYNHAWRKRHDLTLNEAELLTLKFSRRSHVISAGLGVLSLVIVLVGMKMQSTVTPFFAGILYSLMGPLHARNGYQAGKAQANLRKRQTADAKR
jgi:uncharacterized membrane protein